MSKKLINCVEDVVDEALAGLVAACPGLRLLEGHRVIVRADVQTVVTQEKVTLLSGGGSGHEPAHAGYIGEGMLTAAVAGGVFASPPPGSILAALRAIRSPAGTLMIVKNYTGDRLNFGIALERARSEGMQVGMVVIGEDCALPSEGKAAGRRGLCGTVLIHKIAGAMAEEGCSLTDIQAVAERVAASVGTMSVSLSPCSVPGHRPSFSLGDDEMELGLGIHGEAGAERTKIQSANVVVERMINQITSQEKGYQYFQAGKGMSVALVVNNLGGTSNLELLVMANAAIRYLVDKLGLSVDRVVCGSLMTSLEMAGVSLTLLKMEPGWANYIDFPTSAPGWPRVCRGPHGSCLRVDSSPLPAATVGTEVSGKEPTTELGLVLKSCVTTVCDTLVGAEEKLNELDRGSGDGDCGTTLKAGATGIKSKFSSFVWDNPRQVFLALAAAVESDMGGSSGAIYNLFLSAGAAVLETPSQSFSWAKALAEGMQAIMRYGGASVGDRTMLDALSPAVDILTSELGPETNKEQAVQVLGKAVNAAKEGALATTKMEARAGRASYVHSSQLTQPDPGAHAVALWLEAIHKQFQ